MALTLPGAIASTVTSRLSCGISSSSKTGAPTRITPGGFVETRMSQEPTVIDRRPSYDETPVDPVPFTAQPIGDYIVVRRIPEPEGLIIEADVAKDKPVNCQVIAVSAHPSSDLARAALQALTPGDRVLIRRYSGTEVKVNGDEYTLVIIFDVLLKL